MENEARNNENLPPQPEVPPAPDNPFISNASPPLETPTDAPPAPVWPRSAPVDVKPIVTPEGVKLAAVLLIAHGALTALSAFVGGRNAGDLSGLPMALIWLGVTIVLAGALNDRQAWAWWVTTFLGGLLGIFNLLKVIGYVVFSSGNLLEEQIKFSPLLVGLAGLVMLCAVTLLAMPDSKEAFGMKSPPNPLDVPPRSYDEHKHE